LLDLGDRTRKRTGKREKIEKKMRNGIGKMGEEGIGKLTSRAQ